MPTRRGVGSAGLLVAFVLGSLATTVGGGWPLGLVGRAVAARPRIAVVGVSAEQLSSEVRAKMDAAVAGGLAASGADVVDSTTTARRIATKGLGGCETSTCRVAIAEVTGAAYLVRGSVESMGRSYTVRLEMIDGATGNVIGAREDRCDICTESEAYETASVTASALKAEVIKRPGAATGAGGDDGKAASARALAGAEPPATFASRDTTTILAPSSDPAPAAQSAPRFRALSWVGIGAGVLATAAGIYLVSIDGQQNCDHAPDANCSDRTFKTRTGGYALAAGGVLAAALGVTLLVGRF